MQSDMEEGVDQLCLTRSDREIPAEERSDLRRCGWEEEATPFGVDSVECTKEERKRAFIAAECDEEDASREDGGESGWRSRGSDGECLSHHCMVSLCGDKHPVAGMRVCLK